VLGVSPEATYEELKKAYASKAFRLHPDRNAELDAERLEAMEWRMRELNASWAVLRDTARRQAYDAELARTTRPAPAPGSSSAMSTASVPLTDDLPDLEPEVAMSATQHNILRFAPVGVLAVVLLVILIVSAYASSDGSGDRPLVTTERAPVGSCVELGPLPADPDEAATARPELIEVDCGRVGASRVVAKVPFNRPCPAGTTPYPVPEESLSICLGA
jgi:hypothetical protein